MPRCFLPRPQSASPHCGHYAWHHAQCSRPVPPPGEPRLLGKGFPQESARTRGMVSVPVQAVGMAQSQ